MSLGHTPYKFMHNQIWFQSKLLVRGEGFFGKLKKYPQRGKQLFRPNKEGSLCSDPNKQ
jgi:hypothetical protein